jgi:hypothetical protein
MNCDVSYRLQEIESEFDKHVSIKDITQHMDVDPEGRQYIYNYWKLKRKVRYLALTFLWQLQSISALLSLNENSHYLRRAFVI